MVCPKQSKNDSGNPLQSTPLHVLLPCVHLFASRAASLSQCDPPPPLPTAIYGQRKNNMKIVAKCFLIVIVLFLGKSALEKNIDKCLQNPHQLSFNKSGPPHVRPLDPPRGQQSDFMHLKDVWRDWVRVTVSIAMNGHIHFLFGSSQFFSPLLLLTFAHLCLGKERGKHDEDH